MSELIFRDKHSEYERHETLHSCYYVSQTGATPETHKLLLPHGHNRYFALNELIYGFEWEMRSEEDAYRGVTLIKK